MFQSSCSSQTVELTPSAPPPPVLSDDMEPPSYEEAILAPTGGSFANLSSPAFPPGDDAGITWQPASGGGTADLANTEQHTGNTESISIAVTGDTSANTEPSQPVTGGSGDDPPSYQSLFGQIKEAKESSSGICDFISNLFLMPLGCLLALGAVAVVLGLVFGLPVTLITVGSLYLYDCPVAPGIPIWMLVGGVVLVVYTFWVGCTGESQSGNQAVFGVLFYLAWYIAGCVLIYPTWQPAFHPSEYGDTEYCGYTPMLTAFITINLLSILTGLGMCGVSL